LQQWIARQYTELAQSTKSSATIEGDILVHVARSQSDEWTFGMWKTNDGVERAGARLRSEIDKILSEYPTITDLSLVGCSLGGLVIRYCAAQMYDESLKCLTTCPPNARAAKCKRRESEALRASEPRRIRARCLATMASPHLGVDDWMHKRDYRCGKCVDLYSVAQCADKCYLLFPTLRDLMNISPLLSRMADESLFIDSLAAFEKLVAYSNVRGDRRVSCRSAAILPKTVPINTDDYWQTKKKCAIADLHASDVTQLSSRALRSDTETQYDDGSGDDSDEKSDRKEEKDEYLLAATESKAKHVSGHASGDLSHQCRLFGDLEWQRVMLSLNHSKFSREWSHTVVTVLHPKWESSQETFNHLFNVLTT
jgi:hypothetical protein